MSPISSHVLNRMANVANLPDDRMEEVFQGVARMLPILSHVLNRMANVMSGIFVVEFFFKM